MKNRGQGDFVECSSLSILDVRAAFPVIKKAVTQSCSKPFNENLDVKGAVFNGWNQDGDNNNAKSLFFQIGYAPSTNLLMKSWCIVT